MCLAAFLPGGTIMQPDEIRNAWTSNPHGAGFAYIDDGQVKTYRTLSLDKMLRSYDRTLGDGRKDHMVHFRFATHGTRGIENVHPFRVDRHTYVIHNGILSVPAERKRSDTAVFAQDYLAALPPLWFDDPALFDLVESYAIGSKLVVATTHPKAMHNYYIINEDLGSWDESLRWFSNTTYCALPRIPATFTFGQAKKTCAMCGTSDVAPSSDTQTDVCRMCNNCTECNRDTQECLCAYTLDDRIPY